MSMFFKLFGLRYSNPVGPPHLNDKDYLSNLQFARTGDVLIDENGNPISFGAIGIAYGVPPNPYDMTSEETSLWYNLATNSVWSRTLLSDGVTVVDVDTGPTGQGDMRKSVYDTNDDGIVNSADALQVGVQVATASQVISHLDNLAIHRPMNDAITTTTNLWSAQHTQDLLDTKANVIHTQDASTIVSGVFDPARLPLFGTNQNGAVIGPTPEQAGFYLRSDNTWQFLNFHMDVIDPQDGDIFVLYNGVPMNVHLLLGEGLYAEIVVDEYTRTMTLLNTLTLEEARINGNVFEGPVDLLVDPTEEQHLTNKRYVDSRVSVLKDNLDGLPAISYYEGNNPPYFIQIDSLETDDSAGFNWGVNEDIVFRVAPYGEVTAGLRLFFRYLLSDAGEGTINLVLDYQIVSEDDNPDGPGVTYTEELVLEYPSAPNVIHEMEFCRIPSDRIRNKTSWVHGRLTRRGSEDTYRGQFCLIAIHSKAL